MSSPPADAVPVPEKPAPAQDEIAEFCSAMKVWIARPPSSPGRETKMRSPESLEHRLKSPSLAGQPESDDKVAIQEDEGKVAFEQDEGKAASQQDNGKVASQQDNGSVPSVKVESVDAESMKSRGTWSVSDFEAAELKDEHGAVAARSPHTPEMRTHPPKEKLTFSVKRTNVSHQSFVASPTSEARFETPAPGETPGGRIGCWLKDLEEPLNSAVHPAAKVDGFYQCELDACTGELLPEIKYPTTVKNPIESAYSDQKDIGWRQANMTSELQVMREMNSRQRLKDHFKAMVRLEKKLKTPVEASLPEEAPWPNAQCLLRPATAADFAQIADVINSEREMTDCPQMLDSEAVDERDVGRMFLGAERDMRPFIVAVPAEDDLMDRSKWPPNSDRAYQEYIEFRKAQPSTPPAVVGFAIATVERVNIVGRPCPGSRHSLHLQILVHRQHRRKSYGTALLDRMLLCVSPLHRSLISYEWKCRIPARVYESSASHNHRQYARLYMDVFCESKSHADYQWRAEMLGKFNFAEVAYLPGAIRNQKGVNRWLDRALWEFEAQSNVTIRSDSDSDDASDIQSIWKFNGSTASFGRH
ncbi:hypothetical protein CDD83_4181 [Cordyceps sp. RAO-2017]|nr:hypothetical protein CDD83_4181 [Cordyceps sp. RAO-2017]